MRLKLTKESYENPSGYGHEYVVPHSATPSWYMQEIRVPPRKYHVQPPRYQLPGEVLVDDETHTVYVYLCFS